MARPLRIELPGMWFHVMNRGNQRQPIFYDDHDYETFLSYVARGCEDFSLEMHAYVLMPNHFHFFVRIQQPNLSRYMHTLLGAYTGYFHHRHDHVGHLFQGRYKAIVVDSNAYGAGVGRYVHLNPLGSVIADHLPVKDKRRRLRSYPWSSYPAYIGKKEPAPFLSISELIAGFGRTSEQQQRNYALFVEEGLSAGIDNPFDDVRNQSVLGDERFVEQIRKVLPQNNHADSESTKHHRALSAPSLDAIIATVSKTYRIDSHIITQKRSSKLYREPRLVTFWLAARLCRGAMSLREIGRQMGGCTASNVIAACKKIEQQRAQSKRLQKRVLSIENKLKI